MKLSSTRLNTLGIFVAIAGIIFLIYANGLNTPFQSDDERHIYESPQIKNPGYYANPSNIRNRHINGLSFALNYQWGQENPFGYHLFNVLIHIGSTFLVFFITRLTIDKGTSWGKDAAQKIALTTTLLFGLHPIQTETVTYISGRPGGLAGLFYFLSLLLFILASLKDCKFLRLILYPLSLASFAMAVLGKEIAVTLPVMIILYDLCFIKGSQWASFRYRLGYYLCYPALAVAIFFYAPNMLRFMDTLNSENFLKKINLPLGLVQLDLLKHPVKLFLFPVNLTFEYDFLTQVSWPSLLTSIAIVLLCGFLILNKFYLKNSLLTFCVLWFPLTIAPTNSFMERTHLFSERNMYIPSFGLCLFFAVVLFLIGRSQKRGALWGACLLLFICTAFSVMVVKRNQVYTSPSSLWADTFKKSPNKLSVGKTLSIHYLMEEDYVSALKPLKALLKINPNLYDVHQNLGIAHKSLGKFSEAEKNFKEAIRIEPTDPDSHFNLASLYGNLGKFVQASQEFDRADALYRGRGKGPPQQFHFDKARAHNQAGIELIQLQKFDEALIQLEKSVRQNPNLLSARFNLAKLLLEFKDAPQKARAHLDAALALNPTSEQSRVLTGLINQIEKPAP
ncbi:MAG: tetratricopeptide repeat protein [Nitrospinae bacterium]|nr:tetratricopeptide repeat protein [Nitrospinota bacterium]MBL7019235.1 tetratricopeptide repeat protein [Nitrospinaceae bacterium]